MQKLKHGFYSPVIVKAIDGLIHHKYQNHHHLIFVLSGREQKASTPSQKENQVLINYISRSSSSSEYKKNRAYIYIYIYLIKAGVVGMILMHDPDSLGSFARRR